MVQQPCVLVNYLYRRDCIPDSIRWHMNAYRMPGAPVVRVRGFVEQKGDADHLSIVLAVPCLPSGVIELETENEFEDLADEHFKHWRPDQELA
jgi:hypothetical protein